MPFIYSLSIILIAYFLKKISILKADDSGILSRIIMNCTVPAVILLNVTQTSLKPELFYLPFLPVIMAFFGLGFGYFIFRKLPVEIRGLMMMGTMGLNIGLFAFPIIESLFGAEGLGIAAIMDIGNAFTIFGICYLTGAHYSPLKSHTKRGLKNTLLVFIKSVPFMTYILAIVLNLCHIVLPDLFVSWLNIPARANQFLILLVLGLVLNFKWKLNDVKYALKLLSLRYLISIFLALAVWYFMPVEDLVKKVAIMCLLLPTGFTLVPYSLEFGYHRETSDVVVNISLIIGFFSMWGAMILL